jgi:hypothetical protein
MFRDLFGLTVGNPEILTFKSLMARFYCSTYRALLAKILAGPVLHVDETYVKLRTGTGYVWVLASPEEAIFMYRPRREAEFLQKMLRDFQGALVSDSYAGYESLPCPQQKCLIHLIRDMNQDLLTPLMRNCIYHQAVWLTSAFDRRHHRRARPKATVPCATRGPSGGILPGAIGPTAPLRRRPRSLGQATQVAKQIVHLHSVRLSAVEQYNAENAIKQFAYYREDRTGTMKEAGLNDYLVLLSIFQTCRYGGINFLKFLLSRKRDIDAFSATKRIRRRQCAIELYPKGFTPCLIQLGEKGNTPRARVSMLSEQ